MASEIPIQRPQTSNIAKLGDMLKEFRREHTENMAKLKDKVGQIPAEVSEIIADNYKVQTPVSANQLRTIITSFLEQLREEFARGGTREYTSCTETKVRVRIWDLQLGREDEFAHS